MRRLSSLRDETGGPERTLGRQPGVKWCWPESPGCVTAVNRPGRGRDSVPAPGSHQRSVLLSVTPCTGATLPLAGSLRFASRLTSKPEFPGADGVSRQPMLRTGFLEFVRTSGMCLVEQHTGTSAPAQSKGQDTHLPQVVRETLDL